MRRQRFAVTGQNSNDGRALWVTQNGGSFLIESESTQAFDNRDLALFTDRFAELEKSKQETLSISISLKTIDVLPSGFFGMLCRTAERIGCVIYLLNCSEAVQRHYWFRQFFFETAEGAWELSLDSLIRFEDLDHSEAAAA